MAVIDGTTGPDSGIFGTADDDTINGLAGDDHRRAFARAPFQFDKRELAARRGEGAAAARRAGSGGD